MSIETNSAQIRQVVSKVRTKIVDIILELEKQFDDLDDLDIRPQLDSGISNIQEIILNIGEIIYEGNIEIGDKNKINKSSLGKFFKRGGE